MNLRFFFRSIFATLALGTTTCPAAAHQLLWYLEPARTWHEALPIGNGRIGALVHGGTDSELLQLNEGSVWSGRSNTIENPGVLQNLPRIRELLSAGKFAEAEALAKQGSASGLRARGGFTVSITWQGGALTAATVKATHSGSCIVRARTPFQIGAERSRADGSDQVLVFAAAAGQSYRVASLP